MADIVRQDQFKISTRTNTDKKTRRGCDVQLFVYHYHTTDTFISSAKVPAWKRMTVAVSTSFNTIENILSHDQECLQRQVH